MLQCGGSAPAVEPGERGDEVLRETHTVVLEQAQQFLDDSIAVKPSLLDLRADTPLEHRLITRGERFGLEQDNRDLMGLLGLLELFDERKPVHAWYEEVEENDRCLSDRVTLPSE